MSDVTLPKIKKWDAILLEERSDETVLKPIMQAYEASVDDYANNRDYIQIRNALYKIEQRLEKQLKAKSEDDVQSMTAAQKQELVCKLLDPKYRKHFGRDGTKEMLKITDEQNKLVQIVDSRVAIQDQIEQAIANNLVLPPRVVKELADYWKLYGADLPGGLTTYGGFSNDGWCLGRSLVKPSAGEFPTWQRFINRMNDCESFAAWIYGVASKQYIGRQVMWLHGDNGEDGKSFIQKIIVNQLFPNVNAAMNNQALGESGSRFMQADFENKALAFWDDCNYSPALFREDIKSLSSGAEGNPSRIEKKGKQSYTAQLEARLWINSNFAPKVSNDNYITSRLLYIYLAPMEEAPDSTLKSKFIAELPAFLEYGRECFERLCPDNRAIKQCQKARNQIEDLIAENEGEFEAIFDRRFLIVDQETITRASEVARILKFEGLKQNTDHRKFYEWMEKRHGLKKSQINRRDKPKYSGIRGLDLVISL